jgi:hypothetical protein
VTPEGLGGVALSVTAGIALAAATGFRAFLPLLVLSLAARLHLLPLHEGAAFLSGNLATTALLVATLLEILGDKIPMIDHALDVGGTFVRPAAGFLAGLAVLADLPEPVRIVLALVLSMLTLGTHIAHAKTRVGSTVLTAGIGNPILSVFEDAAALILAVLAVFLPIVALCLVLLGGYLLVRFWRGLRRRAIPGSARVAE